MKRLLKKTLAPLLAFLFLASALQGAALAAPLGDVYDANLIKLTSASAFQKGTLEGLTVDASAGDGALKLQQGALSGTYISEEIKTPAFEYLVASWNADTPEGTGVEIFARAYVDKHKAWSSWLSWGTWSPYIKRASTNDEDDLAKVDVDTFTVKGSSGETASRFQFKAVLTSQKAGESPVLRQIAATLKNTLAGQEIAVYHPKGTELPEKVVLDTPSYSQMVRDRAIADVMCSPTTMVMLLNDRGEDLFPEELALNEYDFDYEGFGNWSFTVASAGMYGYDAYCMYADFDTVREQLAQGYSVGISVKYSSSPGGTNPYLENGAANNTGGHLISIVGYETINGVDYFYSNDSAAGSDGAAALRKYKAEQLDFAWSGRLAYIVGDKEQGAGFAAPRRVQAALSYVEGSENEYALMVDGARVELTRGFISGKLRSLGNGTVLAIRGQGEALPVFNDVTVSTTANHKVEYTVRMSDNGNLVIKPESYLQDADEAKLSVYVMANNGVTYVAELALQKEAAAPAPTIAPETPAPEPANTAEPILAEPQDASGLPVWSYILAAAVLLGAALFLLRAGKKRKS